MASAADDWLTQMIEAHDALAYTANNPDAPEAIRQAAQGLATVVLVLMGKTPHG